jgi:acyl carrier protein
MEPSEPVLDADSNARLMEAARCVIELWSEILDVPNIQLSDNFVELGGDSVSATLFVFRVHEIFRVEIPFSVLFDESANPVNLANTIMRLVESKKSENSSSMRPEEGGRR